MMKRLAILLLPLVLPGCSAAFAPGRVDVSQYEDAEQLAIRRMFETWRDAMVHGNLELYYRCLSRTQKEARPFEVFQRQYSENSEAWKAQFAGWTARQITVERTVASIMVKDGFEKIWFAEAVKEPDGWKMNYFVHPLGRGR